MYICNIYIYMYICNIYAVYISMYIFSHCFKKVACMDIRISLMYM